MNRLQFHPKIETVSPRPIVGSAFAHTPKTYIRTSPIQKVGAEPVLRQSREQAERVANDHRHRHRNEDKLKRCGQTLQDDLDRRFLIHPGFAEIALQKICQETDILFVQGQVEAETFAQRGEAFGVFPDQGIIKRGRLADQINGNKDEQGRRAGFASGHR